EYNLGVNFLEGTLTATNYTEAIAWFRRAAEHGDVLANHNLGLLLLTGRGTPSSPPNLRIEVDKVQALKSIAFSAESGFADSQAALAAMYFEGNGVTQSYSEAARWYLLAAEQGSAYAQTMLSAMYLTGHGVTANQDTAVKWLKKAAANGNAAAQEQLGQSYGGGFYGLPQDFMQAIEWTTKAADQGNAEAQNTLGVAYLKGLGVPSEREVAHDWFKRAAAQGNAHAIYNIDKYFNKDKVFTGQ
ncbi:SEL1-like repeat protein, partial [Mesorhizobium sp. M7A.F.Ca.US.007.01.1.1]